MLLHFSKKLLEITGRLLNTDGPWGPEFGVRLNVTVRMKRFSGVKIFILKFSETFFGFRKSTFGVQPPLTSKNFKNRLFFERTC